jgi:hypothetical protein
MGRSSRQGSTHGQELHCVQYGGGKVLCDTGYRRCCILYQMHNTDKSCSMLQMSIMPVSEHLLLNTAEPLIYVCYR